MNKITLLFFLILTNLSLGQSIDGNFEYVLKYKRSNTLFISVIDSSLCYKVGNLYKIMSLKDSLTMEPSYPWHRKTLMSYHINDYDRILKIDTNRVKFDKWIKTDSTKIYDSILLTKYALPIDTLRIQNSPDTIYAWVDLNNASRLNWIIETLILFKVFNGIPNSATVKSIVYGDNEVSLLDLTFTDEQTDFGIQLQYPINIELMEQYKRNGKPWHE